jgi:hypothetical protein
VHRSSTTFGISFSNIPLINLRWEFRAHYDVVRAPGFMFQPDGSMTTIVTPYLQWVGMPDAGASLLAQRALSGLECYMSAAVRDYAASIGRLSALVSQACMNPFALPGRIAAHKYYNALPAVVEPRLAMQISDGVLWPRTVAFYDEVRNPLFHGYEFASHGSTKGIIAAFDHMASMYRWIDSWYNAERILTGATAAFKV